MVSRPSTCLPDVPLRSRALDLLCVYFPNNHLPHLMLLDDRIVSPSVTMLFLNWLQSVVSPIQICSVLLPSTRLNDASYSWLSTSALMSSIVSIVLATTSHSFVVLQTCFLLYSGCAPQSHVASLLGPACLASHSQSQSRVVLSSNIVQIKSFSS